MPRLAPHNVLLGVSLITATAFAISVQDVVFKLFSSEMTLWQIFALRGCFAVPALVLIAVIKHPDTGVLRAAFGKWPVLRALFITGTFLAFYAALPFLSLSTVGAANYTAPIFVTLLSAYALKEPVRVLGWLGVLLGFVGVLILLQPGAEGFSFWAVLPVFGAFLYALAHVITRAKCQDVPLAALSLAQNSMMLLAGCAVSLLLIVHPITSDLAETTPYIFGSWSAVASSDWLVLVLLAGFAVVLGLMLAGAYKAAPPAIVATFEYSYLVFVAAWDILFFGVALGMSTVAGMVLIVLAGILVLRQGPSA
ncbi:MAG: DMT family transporter [Pseudomonadota bacterium]